MTRPGRASSGPRETSVDVVAFSLPCQYVFVAAAQHPERFGRIILISPTGFGRFKGSAGRASRSLNRSLRLTGVGRLLFAVLARRQVIRWFLRQTFADPERVPREYERYCWLPCQRPGAFRAPMAFVSGQLNDPRAEAAYERPRRSSSSGIIRASPIRRLQRRSSLRTVSLSASRSSAPEIFRNWSSLTRRRRSSKDSCAGSVTTAAGPHMPLRPLGRPGSTYPRWGWVRTAGAEGSQRHV